MRTASLRIMLARSIGSVDGMFARQHNNKHLSVSTTTVLHSWRIFCYIVLHLPALPSPPLSPTLSPALPLAWFTSLPLRAPSSCLGYVVRR